MKQKVCLFVCVSVCLFVSLHSPTKLLDGFALNLAWTFPLTMGIFSAYFLGGYSHHVPVKVEKLFFGNFPLVLWSYRLYFVLNLTGQ